MIFVRCDAFKQKSFAETAEEEIYRRIRESSDSPIFVVEEFIKEMNQASCENIRTSYVFSVAKDTGEWILDQMLNEVE